MTSKHSRDYFYKYYSPDAAEAVMSQGSLKWSNPLEFNDPFDNQFNLCVDPNVERFSKEAMEMLLKKLQLDEPIVGTGEVYDILRGIKSRLPKVLTDEDRARMLQHCIEAYQSEPPIEPLSDVLRDELNRLSVFCVSERHDDLLMWSHYAQSHQGVVMKFLCIPDSPLTRAARVEYTDTFPVLRGADFIDDETLTSNSLKAIVLTKSSHWSYEREWRSVSFLKDKNLTSEIRSFNPQELGEIFFGCRMLAETKEKLIHLIKKKYPWVKLHQGQKCSDRFGLEFESL